MNNSNIRMQVLCALFAAFCAVCSQLTIPIQPVPITLGTFAVLLAGGFGAAGVPVFSMMRSGVSVIAGPAGGFIIGFAVMAFVTGLISEKYGYSFKTMLIASVCGTLGCYILGIVWFIFLTGTGVWSAFLLCMFPFLPGDLAKILLASFLVSKYRGRLIQG